MGLAISRELIERMGGEIDFESVEGEGAKFFFDLPIWNEEDVKPVVAPLHPVPASAPRILVVEDDEDAAHLLGLLLTHAGYAVDIAYNGEQALNALDREDYSAMTLDLMLPDMSGLEIIRQVRRQAAIVDLPIMVVSGKIEEGILAVSGDFTNIDWLPKPIDETQLLKKMQKLLTISTGQALRVLHVENDTDLQQVVHSVIAGQFEVEAVTTLTDARARLSREHFDIVLLNLGLPDGSGWDLLPEIRSRLPKAKVIILSGMDVSLDAAREVEAVLLKSKMSPQKLLDAMTAQVGLTNSEGTT